MLTKTNQYHPQIAFHPGETLAEKLEELGMGPKEFAVRTGKPEKTISAILSGKSSITPEMAIQFEKALQIPARFWLNMQVNYDEFLAREERTKRLAASTEWAKLFPIADMVEKGWLPSKKTLAETLDELLSFFGIDSPNAWEDFYINQQLKVAFRISLANTKEPYAISAWLRKGEIQAAALHAEPFDEKKFKETLPLLKSIMAKHPQDFFAQLQQLCLKAGVKVVHTPCIKKAPIYGCTRWIHDTPLIQLTGRYQRNDIFWFTFFHEAGHILLHGKKDIFLENIDYSDKDIKKEQEADDFAVKWTLSKEEEALILERFKLSENEIIEFAEKFNTHPAMIVGRWRRLGLVTQAWGKKFLQPVHFD